MTRKIMLAAMLAAALALTACGGDDSTEENVRTGEFELVDGAPDGFDGAGGSAEIVRSDDGTEVSLDVEGLPPEGTFAAHLHAGGCDQPDPGGPHFRFELNGAEMPPNEIHLPFETDGEGAGSSDATNDQTVPEDEGLSVVIHEETGEESAAGHSHDEEMGDMENMEEHEHDHGSEPKALCANLG